MTSSVVVKSCGVAVNAGCWWCSERPHAGSPPHRAAAQNTHVASACLPTLAPQIILPNLQNRHLAPTLPHPVEKQTVAPPSKEVFHKSKQVLHCWTRITTWRSATRHTKRRKWLCGNPTSPSKFAHFLAESHTVNTEQFDCCSACSPDTEVKGYFYIVTHCVLFCISCG